MSFVQKIILHKAVVSKINRLSGLRQVVALARGLFAVISKMNGFRVLFIAGGLSWMGGRLERTRSVRGCVPTQSVGTIYFRFSLASFRFSLFACQFSLFACHFPLVAFSAFHFSLATEH
jgi:hypothetical protein